MQNESSRDIVPCLAWSVAYIDECKGCRGQSPLPGGCPHKSPNFWGWGGDEEKLANLLKSTLCAIVLNERNFNDGMFKLSCPHRRGVN
jgi:hypothetical protein